MHVVAVCNQKGGVGKSTAAMGLAAVIAGSGRCLLVDVDPQRTAAEWCETGQRSGTLPFDFTASTDPEILQYLRKDTEPDYDYIVVDTPGKLENTGVLGAVLDQADFAVIPVTPAVASMSPTLATVALIREKNVRHKALIDIVDGRRRGHAESMRRMLDEEGVPVFNRMISAYVAHEYAPGTGVVVTQYGRSTAARSAADDYFMVALELDQELSAATGVIQP